MGYSSGVVACTAGVGNTVSIAFETELGDLPALEYIASDGTAITAFTIDTDGTGTSVQGTVENAECSDSGICDTFTGKCDCFPGMGSSSGSNGIGTRNDCGFILSELGPVE